MSQSITISQTEYEKLLERISRLEKTIRKLLKKKEPEYGSDKWWDEEIKKGEEDIKKGRYQTFSNAKDLQVYLNSLKK